MVQAVGVSAAVQAPEQEPEQPAPSILVEVEAAAAVAPVKSDGPTLPNEGLV